jgi:hypothetical protein
LTDGECTIVPLRSSVASKPASPWLIEDVDNTLLGLWIGVDSLGSASERFLEEFNEEGKPSFLAELLELCDVSISPVPLTCIPGRDAGLKKLVAPPKCGVANSFHFNRVSEPKQ